MNASERHHFYWSGPFSQWQPCRIALWDLEFCTAEQAMMFAKARLFGDEEIGARIVAEPDPGAQKALGRQVSNFDEAQWDASKVGIVREINLAKFDQNKGLRRKLFQTAPALLVEASPLDTIWGIGLDADAARITPVEDWPGQNLLGRVLMDVRDALTMKYPDEARACAPGLEETR